MNSSHVLSISTRNSLLNTYEITTRPKIKFFEVCDSRDSRLRSIKNVCYNKNISYDTEIT